MACRIWVTSLMEADYSPRCLGEQDPARRHSGEARSRGGGCPLRGREPRPLSLAPDDLLALQQLAHAHLLPFCQVQRARVLLEVASGQRIVEVACRNQCDPSTVWRICRRYQQGGLARLLDDLPGARASKTSPPSAAPSRPGCRPWAWPCPTASPATTPSATSSATSPPAPSRAASPPGSTPPAPGWAWSTSRSMARPCAFLRYRTNCVRQVWRSCLKSTVGPVSRQRHQSCRPDRVAEVLVQLRGPLQPAPRR